MKLVTLGPPGAGKGTIAVMLSKKFKIPHISTGDLFRENLKNKTELGNKANEYMEKGELVPDEITTDMLKERIERDDCKNGFILDGFPRTIPQADSLKTITDIDKTINFVVSEQTILERLTGRRTCKKCGSIFHIKNLPPKKEGICDNCSSELYQRDDQKPDVIKERLEVYKKQTEPLIEYYKKEALLADIDAEKTPEEIFDACVEALS